MRRADRNIRQDLRKANDWNELLAATTAAQALQGSRNANVVNQWRIAYETSAGHLDERDTQHFRFTNIAPANAVAVHAGYAGNNASNSFPGPFTNPAAPRNATVTFAAGWDGGNVTVVGTDQFNQATSDVIVASAGNTVAGVKIFKTVTSATKGAIGASAATASIGTGNKIGVPMALAAASGTLLVYSTLHQEGKSEAVVVDNAAQRVGFTPTTPPDGEIDYRLTAPIPAPAGVPMSLDGYTYFP